MMTTFHKKHQILESLSGMDQAQTEKVLAYVKSLSIKSTRDSAYERFKNNAMREIREALAQK